jgi:hypothetical protein
MGYLIGFILAAALLVMFGVGIGRATVPVDDRTRKAELKRAKQALSDLDKVIYGSGLELEMLGSDIGTKSSEILRRYWQGNTN